MAELNDFFIRTLRNSARQQRTANANANGSVVSGKVQAQSIMTARPSSNGISSSLAAAATLDSSSSNPKREAMNNRTRQAGASNVPPDLLANLLPRRHDDPAVASLRQQQPSPLTKTTNPAPRKQPEPDHVSSGSANVNRITCKLSTPKKLWNTFTSKCVTTSSVHVVKEYQPPVKLIQEKTATVLARRNSLTAAASALNKTDAPLRIVPTWFPPANIPKLRRQGSFHGETAASRLLRAKQQQHRVMEQEAKGRSPPTKDDGIDAVNSLDSTSTPTIPEEPDGMHTETVPKRPPRLQKPKLTIDTRPVSPLPTVCARHMKHHAGSAAAQSFVAACPKSADLRSAVNPGSPSGSRRITDHRGGRPRSIFKFGTLPRSFRMSNSHSPTHSTQQLAIKPSASSCDLCEPKTAPIVQGRPAGRQLKRSQSFRNSWHVTTPSELAAVKRPDVALSNDENVWLSPLVSPVVPQKICTCGDTRKHVHLVKFGDDLTLTDTRYFVEEDGTENGQPIAQPAQSVPATPVKISHAKPVQRMKSRKSPPPPPVAESESETDNSTADVHKSSEASHESSSGISTEEETLEKEMENLKHNLSSRSSLPANDCVDVLSGTIANVQNEIDSFNHQNNFMLRKLLDLSDQIRHWNGRRKHRIRSVDSISPLLSASTAKDFPVLAVGNCQLQSIPELRRNRTLSMDDIGLATYKKEQVTDKAAPPLAVAALISDPFTSASQLRSNVHLSYSDLLKNSSKFWQPSQPGCNNETSSTNADSTATSACILQEASLSLLL
ncbi:LOW QUALITY PROTEIN: uncharacterized protein LOC129588064 [Paramacrobiotus metropolitanus]|uniref:LOW QUALITY PROTEIN: uncharacterized protein LOC129588064 n=1 Tax=Paramacrobiotus metropolitanus TaxID=2943436 RepID=UPI00244611D8|nr:LOW QUALITY PROTEIN: uncharacterized protein LOC129588064 [Paramacrobiotus metropolitanus]